MAADPRTPALDAFVSYYLDAWGRHDAAALTGLYAPDADLTNFRGKLLHGKDDILGFFTKAFKQNLAAVQLSGAERRIRFVSSNVATMDVSATITGEKDPKGAA